MSPDELAAWTATAGTVATCVVGVLELFIRKVGGAVIEVAHGTSADVAGALGATVAKVDELSDSVTSQVAVVTASVAEIRSDVRSVQGRVAALERGLGGRCRGEADAVVDSEPGTPQDSA